MTDKRNEKTNNDNTSFIKVTRDGDGSVITAHAIDFKVYEFGEYVGYQCQCGEFIALHTKPKHRE